MRGTKITLTFGMVTIPCKRGPATKDARLKANRICTEHMHKIRLQSICDCGEEHVVEDPVAGYDVGDGTFVVVPRETCQVEKDGVLALTSFVDDFDPALYEKNEILAADRGGEPAFEILAAALRERGGVAVGTCVLNKARRMVGVRWSDALGCVTLHVLAFDREVRWDDARDASPGDNADPAQVDMAVQLLESLADTADICDAADEYDDAVRALVAQASPELAPAESPAIPDLKAALEASVAEVKSRRKVKS